MPADHHSHIQPPYAAQAQKSYSRMVRLLRISLPVMAALMLVLVFIWPMLTDQLPRLQETDLTLEQQAEGVILATEHLRFSGAGRGNQPFTLTADRAVIYDDDRRTTVLTRPLADVFLQSPAGWLALMAERGHYDEADERLHLAGNVRIFHDDGYEFKTENAFYDVRAERGWGLDEVYGQSAHGRIEAQGFDITAGGAQVSFTGPARMTIYAASLALPQRE